MASNPTILYQYQVSPPDGSVPDTSVPLSFFDAAWLFTGPLERLFFFSLPNISTSDFTSTYLPKLKSSLSETLKQFYPLAGCVRPCPDPSDDNQFEFFFSSNGAIPFTLAETSSNFDELISNEAKKFEGLSSLVPQAPRGNNGTTPLTSIQVTLFPLKGICIGVSIHHVACDDSSFMHFIQSWATTCQAGSEPLNSCEIPPPLFDRGLVPDPNRLYFKTLSEMKQMLSNGPPPPPSQSDHPPVEKSQPLISTFVLTRDQINALKTGVISEFNDPELHCSSFTVACAYAWVCLIKSQKENSNTDDKKTHLLFSVECRARMDPPIPKGYFGNCLRPCFVETNMHELYLPEGVFIAAREIGKAIKLMENGVLEGAEGWFKKILSIVMQKPMSIGGSPRFRVYDIDFGWGKPVKVELPTIEKTPGTVSLAESRDGNGGIEIGVVLPENEMRGFESCFSNGLLKI